MVDDITCRLNIKFDTIKYSVYINTCKLNIKLEIIIVNDYSPNSKLFYVNNTHDLEKH